MMHSTDTRIETGLLKILLVEDAKIVRMGLRLALEEFEDIQVVGEAGSCEEALFKVRAYQPNVVILDLTLPDGCGLGVLRELHLIDAGIKTVVLSSNEDREEVLSSLNSGAHAYCLKNIQAEDLVAAIRLVSHGGMWLDPGIAMHARNHFRDSGARTTLNQALAGGSSIRPRLTKREREVLELLVEGQNNQQIANNLHISIHTVKAAVRNILRKSHAQDRVQLAVRAIREQFV